MLDQARGRATLQKTCQLISARIVGCLTKQTLAEPLPIIRQAAQHAQAARKGVRPAFRTQPLAQLQGIMCIMMQAGSIPWRHAQNSAWRQRTGMNCSPNSSDRHESNSQHWICRDADAG